MLGFLQPIWLFAMAGIIAPVVIHLWNNKTGRVLSIGSIDFLDRVSLKKARSRRISDWWLLVLRCLLLILLALLLAGPVWKQRPGADGKKGWVLVGGAIATGTSQVDSLVAAGFQRHDMTGDSWWESFHALDQQAPAGIPFYVFTDGLLRHFSGVRPVSSRPVYWYVGDPKDSTVQWVQAAWKLGFDSMRVITASSRAKGTSYSYRIYGRDTTAVDTTTLHVVIYADEKYTHDGQWVDGAVRALQQFTRRNIVISGRLDGPADWVFWLSAKPLDIKGANIVSYEPGRETPVDTWIRGSDIPVEKEAGQSRQWLPVWTDGFGRPLLALEETDGGRRYHFYSHFDPTWNGLVWSRDFPVRMGELLLPDAPTKGADRRVIDSAQVTPSGGDNGQRGNPVMETSIDLSNLGWLLVFLTLAAERILSFKRAKNG
ncbi:MAG TPA: BatA domain-containing protein [Puia sp.]|nr:BatA domain-containing protein [Puia sp.]